MYFLDTNTCIYFLNGKHESVKDKLLATPPNDISIPSIVKAELLLGAYKSRNKKSNTEKVEQLLAPFEIVPFEDLMTYVYAEIRGKIERKGEAMGPNDLLIAAIVKFCEGTIVTHNAREFKRIDGLKVEDWVK
jgi:tRNA(fMet)-specific endonuclease VapC